MHIVRQMKKYNHIQVANAMFKAGYSWRNPKRRPKNIERMVMGLPRVVLDEILGHLNALDA